MKHNHNFLFPSVAHNKGDRNRTKNQQSSAHPVVVGLPDVGSQQRFLLVNQPYRKQRQHPADQVGEPW